MIAPPRKTAGAAGFTLVELLVAIVLTALLVVVLHEGFRIGTHAATVVDRDNERTSEIALAYDFLERELSAAVPLPTGEGNAGGAVDFVGQAHSLSVVTLPPAYLALGGFHLLHLRLEPSARGGNRLVVSWAIVPRGPAAAVPARALRPSVVMDHVRMANFGYFGASVSGKAAVWSENWTGRPTLPWLIRLRIVLDDGTRLPDLVVQPRLGNAVQP